jgi:nicotinamidase-related amidase
VVSGVETHICVLQTVLDLLQTGYRVAVVADAIGARSSLDHQWGLHRMEHSGAMVVTAEMVIYELLRQSDSENFKKILLLIKQLKS